MIWKDFSWREDTVLNWCERKYFGLEKKLTFNVTYYSVFRHLKSQLKELHVILACDEDHKKIFPEVPIIDFKNN